MNLLHLVFAFNLVTAIFILAGAYYLHFKYDENTTGDSRDYSNYAGSMGTGAAGVVGAMISVGLLGGLATLFA
ncbi:MAG: hypothetical protein ACRCWJ_20910 [Casimicrobium sp.]